jgi:hypothetical protein
VRVLVQREFGHRTLLCDAPATVRIGDRVLLRELLSLEPPVAGLVVAFEREAVELEGGEPLPLGGEVLEVLEREAQ